MGDFLDGAGAQVIGSVYDQLTMGQQNERQEEFMELQQINNLALQQNQMENQMKLNQQGHNLQYDMWNKTNYGAQMKHLKGAGLNPALMYGKGGGSGQTGSQGGGSAAGGSAGLGMAAKAPGMELYGHQAELMRQQARIAGAQADKVAGPDTDKTSMEIDNLQIEGKAKEQGIKLDEKKVLQIEQQTKKLKKEIELNYTEKTGTNNWANIERLVSGEYDTSQYWGLAGAVVTLATLRNPVIWRNVFKGAPEKAKKVSGAVGSAYQRFKNKMRQNAQKQARQTNSNNKLMDIGAKNTSTLENYRSIHNHGKSMK